MTLAPPMETETGWRKLQSPELIQWDKPGTIFAGVLSQVRTVEIHGKRVPEYTLTLGEQRFRFLGTYDIVQKLTPMYRGCQIKIKYLGEDEEGRDAGDKNAMKRFDIHIKGSASTNNHGVPITDEDIPF